MWTNPDGFLSRFGIEPVVTAHPPSMSPRSHSSFTLFIRVDVLRGLLVASQMNVHDRAVLRHVPHFGMLPPPTSSTRGAEPFHLDEFLAHESPEGKQHATYETSVGRLV